MKTLRMFYMGRIQPFHTYWNTESYNDLHYIQIAIAINAVYHTYTVYEKPLNGGQQTTEEKGQKNSWI